MARRLPRSRLVPLPPDALGRRRGWRHAANLPSPELFVQVVDGPNAGREIALDKAETLVGRVGLEVVALRRSGEHVALVRVEGPTLAGGKPRIARTAPPRRRNLLGGRNDAAPRRALTFVAAAFRR